MFDFRKYKEKIAEATVPLVREVYADATKQEIEEFIDRHHNNKPPENEKESFVRSHLVWIESAIKKGWIK